MVGGSATSSTLSARAGFFESNVLHLTLVTQLHWCFDFLSPASGRWCLSATCKAYHAGRCSQGVCACGTPLRSVSSASSLRAEPLVVPLFPAWWSALAAERPSPKRPEGAVTMQAIHFAVNRVGEAGR